MALLGMCQEVADVVGVQRPISIITSQDQLARQLLALSRETIEELSLMDWPVLVMSMFMPTVTGQAAYDLPPDFEHQIGDTMYMASRYEQLRGQMTPGSWNSQRNALPDIGRFRFRIFGNPLKLNLTPTPQMPEDVVYEYKTNNRVIQTTGKLIPTYASDDDTSIVPEEIVKKGLKWRLRRAKGLDYSEEFDDYEFARNSRLAQQLQLGSMPVAVRSPFDDEPAFGYVPETGYGQ